MTLQPDTQESIFERIKSAIASASKITNFSSNSPEKAIADDAFAGELRERQHEALAVQLSARIQYAGKGTDDSEARLDHEDFADLELQNPQAVDIDLLYEYMAASDLDELVARNAVSRDPGSYATGEVEFSTVDDSTVIDDGTQVSTGGDDPIIFETTEEVSPSSGSTTVTASIQALERGTQGNVGAGAISSMPSPPSGVTGVSNPNATSGGEDAETNAELRSRAQDVLLKTSGGGTKGGVEGGMIAAFDGLDESDVIVDEDFGNNNFDVIVDGGPSDADAQEKINKLQPVAVNGDLVRPTEVTIDVSADVTGTDIDTASVEEEISEYLAGLGIGQDVIRDQLITTIMTADLDIEGIDTLSTSADGSSFSGDYTIADREAAVPGTISVTVV